MKKYFEKNKINNEQGFTIVEVLISLTIFSIAVAGVITVAAQGGLSVNASKDKLTATYLADEGIELMRGLRDTNVAVQPIGSESAGWTAFQTAVAGCTSLTPCDIDSTALGLSDPFPAAVNIIGCPLTGCPLYYSEADPYKGYYLDHLVTGLIPISFFSRKISVDHVTDDEMTVTSTVTWKEGITPQSVVQTEEIFNWY